MRLINLTFTSRYLDAEAKSSGNWNEFGLGAVLMLDNSGCLLRTDGSKCGMYSLSLVILWLRLRVAITV